MNTPDLLYSHLQIRISTLTLCQCQTRPPINSIHSFLHRLGWQRQQPNTKS